MNRIWLIAIFFTFIGGTLGGCKTQEEPPENLIPEDTYIDLMVEFQLLESYRNSMPADSVATDSLKEVIFKKYSVSEDQFLDSKEYYEQDYKSHIKRVEKAIEQLRIDQVQEDSTANSDSVKQKLPQIRG